MTRKEVILNAIQNMNDCELYTLYDEGCMSFRGLGLDESGPNVCELCRFHRDSCTLPDYADCPDDIYTAWMRVEVSGDGKRD